MSRESLKLVVAQSGSDVNRVPQTKAPDPEEGIRLVRAFLQIEDPALRRRIVYLVEKLKLAGSKA